MEWGRVEGGRWGSVQYDDGGYAKPVGTMTCPSSRAKKMDRRSPALRTGSDAAITSLLAVSYGWGWLYSPPNFVVGSGLVAVVDVKPWCVVGMLFKLLAVPVRVSLVQSHPCAGTHMTTSGRLVIEVYWWLYLFGTFSALMLGVMIRLTTGNGVYGTTGSVA